MPYLDDLISSGPIKEIFSSEDNSIEIASAPQIKELFPDVHIPDSKNICYFPFNLCSSLPVANQRGRAFTHKVLENSFASLHDQLIDMEHLINANGLSQSDNIVGFVKDVRFNPPVLGEVANNITKPASVTGLGALFLRANGAKDVVRSHFDKTKNWMVSMECGHSWRDAYFLYRDELIPVIDAEIAMRDCVRVETIKPYRGHPLIACLGGLEGKVDFWGTALTTSAADGTADVPFFFTGVSQELSNKKRFFSPFEIITEKELELANITVDKKLDQITSDIAKIEEIGETAPAGLDNHTHKILSNGTIFPTNGHNHHIDEFSLTKGTKPTFSGITSQHHRYNEDSRSEDTHIHTFDISLKGKTKPAESTEVGSLNTVLDEESEMKIEELYEKFEKLLDKGGNDAEIASIRAELSELKGKEVIESEKKKYVEELIKDGSLISKEVAEESQTKAVEEAVKEVEEKHEEENKIKEAIAARIQKCTDQNIDVNAVFEGINDPDGKPMTIKRKIELTPVDEAGEQAFTMDLISWSGNPVLALNKEESTEEEAIDTSKEGVLAEAANKPRLQLVGSKTTDTETANKSKKETKVPAHLNGRGIFKK